ncbi:hypothetical protein ACQUW6_25200 [Bacillus thuringiensis]|uniref:hypothetical protein n=1 Tax=Bacillus thuringiensis TaxID=1428 RepID=UPI003D14C92C
MAYPGDIFQYTETGNMAGTAKLYLSYIVEGSALSCLTNSGGKAVTANDGKRKFQTMGLGFDAVKEVTAVMFMKNMKSSNYCFRRRGNSICFN